MTMAFGAAVAGEHEAGLPRSVETLAPEERRRISQRLVSALVAVGLLGLGTLLMKLRPEEWQIGELLRASAAAVVGIPTLLSGLRGFFSSDTRRATDQLVALAVLAAAASGQFATATLIPLLLELGRLFEERSSLGARAAVEGIRQLAARHAVRWRDGKEERIAPQDLRPGDEILVRPGDRIAVDGTVLEGRAAVDSSAITGEARHEDVAPGTPVFAGAVVLDGLLRVRVRGTGADTVLGRVVQLLIEMEGVSVPAQRLLERRAGAWLPLVLTVAATVLFFTEDLTRAIAVLVAATPTPLVVAVPAAVVAAMTVASRHRILIKSTDFLERAAEIDTLILDKTGTVTVGAAAVDELVPEAGSSIDELLAVGASCGFGSLHPVSRAVVAEAALRQVRLSPPSELRELPGLGVVAQIGGVSAALGRRALLAELGIAAPAASEQETTEVWVALDGKCLGRIVLRDRPRAEARAAIDAIRALGIDRLVLLTGDRAAVASDIARTLGLDEFIAEVLPEQKLEVVRKEQAAGRCVMMVGDGVNDAPALAGADIGVAIGAEVNEVALGGADVALLGTDLGRLPLLLELGERTRRILGQNVWLAFGLSLVLIALAAAGTLVPLATAFAQSAAVILVIINSARILRFAGR